MTARFGLALALAAFLAAPALAQTVIVNDNFDSYADDTAFQAVWVPTHANGTVPAAPAEVNSGILTTDSTTFPDIQGKAVDHIGATTSPSANDPSPTRTGQVNQWGGVINQSNGEEPDFTINPSDQEHVFLSGDIFVGASGNERMSVGLRQIVGSSDGADADPFPEAATTNIFEMGVWNAAPTVLGIEGTSQTATGYAFRIVNFGPVSEPLTAQPNWQYFLLPQELDRTTDADEVVNIADIGAGWHTYTAAFTPTEVTVTIDLFRDGVRNETRDENGDIVVGQGMSGPDASLTLPVATHALGFNSLRIGGPSGLSSAGTGPMGFDNILLQLQAPATGEDDADFDGDGDVDGDDFLTWQRNLGAMGTGTLATGDANDDMNVDAADLTVWQSQFGPGAPATAAASAIPEPTTLAMAAFSALAAIAAARRR